MSARWDIEMSVAQLAIKWWKTTPLKSQYLLKKYSICSNPHLYLHYSVSKCWEKHTHYAHRYIIDIFQGLQALLLSNFPFVRHPDCWKFIGVVNFRTEHFKSLCLSFRGNYDIRKKRQLNERGQFFRLRQWTPRFLKNKQKLVHSDSKNISFLFDSRGNTVFMLQWFVCLFDQTHNPCWRSSCQRGRLLLQSHSVLRDV